MFHLKLKLCSIVESKKQWWWLGMLSYSTYYLSYFMYSFIPLTSKIISKFHQIKYTTNRNFFEIKALSQNMLICNLLKRKPNVNFVCQTYLLPPLGEYSQESSIEWLISLQWWRHTGLRCLHNFMRETIHEGLCEISHKTDN